MPKKDDKFIFKGEQLLEHMIQFTHINVHTNSDDYIYPYFSIEVSHYQQWFVLNPLVEDLHSRFLELADVGKAYRGGMQRGRWTTWG